MRTALFALSTLVALAAAPLACRAQAPADDTERPARHRARIGVGPELGLFIPASGKTRDRFGATWSSVSIGVGFVEHPHAGTEVDPSFDLFWKTSGDDHAFVLPVGVEVRHTFRHSGLLHPYVGATAGGLIADVRSDQDNVHSGFRLGGAGGVFVGTHIGPQAWVEARYYGMSRVKDFDFSGLNLTAGIHF